MPVLAAMTLLAGFTAAAACSGAPVAGAGENWSTAPGAHPLTGTVLASGRPLVDPTSCRVPALRVLRERIAQDPPDILLLGEVHDNGEHHAYRALWLPSLAPAAVVFEQVRADQQPALDAFAARTGPPARSAADLFSLLQWEASGWPDRKLYEPLFAAALLAKLPIVPGDPARGRTREIARGGIAAIDVSERTRFDLETPLPQPLSAALAAELKGSHCGMLPDTAIPGMALAQRYRDAHLADALIAAQKAYGRAILIAGNGHVRSDRGVPFHLRQRVPELKVTSVMLLEVADGEPDASAYGPRGADGRLAADYVVFTPRAARPDPCEGMRRIPRSKP